MERGDCDCRRFPATQNLTLRAHPTFSPRKGSRLPFSRDCYFFKAEEPKRAVATVLRLVQASIPGKFGISFKEIQILTSMQRGELGARNLNQVLQVALNPDGPTVQRLGWTFRAGDRVMQTVTVKESFTDKRTSMFNESITDSCTGRCPIAIGFPIK